MEVTAKAKHLRMSPQKVRLVAGIVRGMSAVKSLDQLRFINKLAAKPIIKLINSAVANATNNFELDKNNLYIKEIRVDEGATLKRWMPKARGRATPVRKRTSHISVVLAELVESGKTGAKKQKIEAPIKLGSKPKEDDGVKIKKGDDKKINEDSRYYRISAHLADLPAKRIPTFFNVLFRQYAELSLLRHHIAILVSTGILTCFPSTFTFVYVLGPD